MNQNETEPNIELDKWKEESQQKITIILFSFQGMIIL